MPSDFLAGGRTEAMRWEGMDLAAKPRVMERRAWLSERHRRADTKRMDFPVCRSQNSGTLGC